MYSLVTLTVEVSPHPLSPLYITHENKQTNSSLLVFLSLLNNSRARLSSFWFLKSFSFHCFLLFVYGACFSMAVSKLGASSRFNLILYLYGALVFYSFLCLVSFVYFGCFGIAGLNLATSSYINLILFV